MLGIVSLLTAGCTTRPPSQIPEMIQSLEAHDFNPEEKQTISELLRYINYLEHEL